MALTLVIEHKFGPMKEHYRVVRVLNMNIGLQTMEIITKHLNKVFGVAIEGKTIYPRIGQQYAVYRKEDVC